MTSWRTNAGGSVLLRFARTLIAQNQGRGRRESCTTSARGEEEMIPSKRSLPSARRSNDAPMARPGAEPTTLTRTERIGDPSIPQSYLQIKFNINEAP